MKATIENGVAIVGLGTILPDAPTVDKFWQNIVNKRYSIDEVPPERWSVTDYYDPDPKAPDKTYSKIGGWVRGFEFDWRRFRMPPKVAEAMDQSQQWALTIAADALADYGYPERPLDTERTAVILGTAMGGELHYETHLRVIFPEFVHALEGVEAFEQLPLDTRRAILERWHEVVDQRIPPITEDSMPGELPNIVSGRVANILNLRGPNFITDAACASSFAAVQAAVELLAEHKVDAALTGGVDRNMGISSFVKFCKIGALSPTGTRPFGDGADGFVMGEGAAAFLLKRLADAERDGDQIYAVIRGVGGASDGKGKGITAPNPIGQRLAVSRAWEAAGLEPATAGLIEAHGTSTRVGDVVEVESLTAVFGGAPRESVGLGSVKSNIGHLKAGAGAAGMLKAVLALHHKVLPPTLNAEKQNPNIAFAQTPFRLIHQAGAWNKPNGDSRRCGVSAYGFGGTNFHLVLEEHVPGLVNQESRIYAAAAPEVGQKGPFSPPELAERPLRGILALGGSTPAELQEKLAETAGRVEGGWSPPPVLPPAAVCQAAERLFIDFGDRGELRDRVSKAQKALSYDSPQTWQAMQAQGIFRGRGPRQGKLAFLFPGQGSQYVNMGRDLAEMSPVVAEVFDEADRIMGPILDRPLTDFIFVDPDDPQAVNQATLSLMQTEITQPAMLTLDMALYQLLAAFGIQPEMVMGHSLGEYAALIAAGVMPFAHALEAAAARGSEMSKVSMADNGKMAAVLAPYEQVEATLAEVDGYVVPANINSYGQSVIGGASEAVERAVKAFEEKGYQALLLPVSHAFHTSIVAPASEPLRQVLDRLDIAPPRLPIVANVSGDFYPTSVEEIKDVLQRQVASPVQWVKGLETLYTAGARTFIEVGPKRALRSFARDVFERNERADVTALITNHPKYGQLATFNQALCGLYAAGYGPSADRPQPTPVTIEAPAAAIDSTAPTEAPPGAPGGEDAPASLETFSRLLAQALKETKESAVQEDGRSYDRNRPPVGSVVISGTGLGLPGAEKQIMDPDNVLRILRGEGFVDLIPERFRRKMVEKHITRLEKAADGSGRFVAIDDPSEVVRLAGRPGAFDLSEEYGVPEKLAAALDVTSQLAMAAGLDALREAGIPLVQTYKRTTTGKDLPERWLLPEALRDETGVIFASAFPGGDRFAEAFERYYTYKNRVEQLAALEDLRNRTTDQGTLLELNRRLGAVREDLSREPYAFDRRFIFRILAMGHSQFAEYIGARGPNTQVNAACASTTQAIAMAEDWIRAGRCRRVLVIAADDVTGDHLLEWVGAGFLALGAAATDDRVEEAALPFDRRRHGTLLGMGACALVVESEDTVRERGMRAIVELLSSEMRNSAFHGSRLDVDHIAQVMNDAVTTAERRFGLHRQAIAPQLVFMSHETYTPARGGSASAEVAALRQTFGRAADEVIIANTKGFTGHPMGVGVEDVIALKILEHGIVPPVPNHREVDPELGSLNLSRGGRYPVQYALHLAAGFGSQIAITFTRRIPGAPERVDNRPLYDEWLNRVSGYDRAELEVKKRVLRIKDEGAPPHMPAASTWRYGTGPVVRALVGDGLIAARQLPQAATEPPSPAAPQLEPLPRAERLVPGPDKAEVEPIRESAEPLAEASIAPAGDEDSVADQVLALVAEQTGYPEDMLELDLDLEADLGIDTVKQAETFAAIRERFDIAGQDDLKLRDYPTLGHVIQFVREARSASDSSPDRTPTPAPTPVEPLVEASTGAADEALPTGDSVADQVLALVAEQTGYPEDMLELDLDLEADLGIDTVKQAETFAAIRERFDIAGQDDLKLRDYPTLGHVIQFVREARTEAAGEEGGEAAEGEEDGETEEEPSLARPAAVALEAADQIPRRVVVPVLRPPLALCAGTGVVLDNNSRAIVALDQGGIGRALVRQLEKRGVTALVLEGASDGSAEVEAWLAEGPVQGVFWLPALDVEPDLAAIEPAEWRTLNQVRVKNLARTMRRLYDVVDKPGTFLVAATRLGGLHGYGPEGAMAPLGGAVCGFAKAYKRERPAVTVKVVDLEAGSQAEQAAEQLVDETLGDPGLVEVGYWGGRRYTVGLEEAAADGGEKDGSLNRESVVLVTGAAGGITSAIVADLAAASGATFYLLDLAPLPDPANPEVLLFRQDKEACKERLIAEARAAGNRPTPVAIEKQLLAIERQEAALRAVEAVVAAGGSATYHSVNLLDGPAVAAVVDEVRQRHGRIDLLLHAAGMEISRALGQKDQAQFDLVFDVKADGFYHLLRAAGEMPIGATVVFSSVAGRFGNAGQTDYSAANDLLCKLTSSLRRWRPETRGIAIDWTAWDEIGMATRGSIPKIMALAGIDLLPPKAGKAIVRRELAASTFQGEIVAAGALGRLADEWASGGGLDQAKANQWLVERRPPGLMACRITGAALHGGLEFETQLDPQQQPFLYDHALEGTPVLPGVMGLEAFAELATVLLPDCQVTAARNVAFLVPFKFYRMEPQTLYLSATVKPTGEDAWAARATLRSRRALANPALPSQEKLHFTGEVLMGERRPAGPVGDFRPPENGAAATSAENIYRVFFHGPAYQVLEKVWIDGQRAVGLMAADLPPDTEPPGAASHIAPRLLELCFQTAGVWEIRARGALALPSSIASVTFYRPAAETNGRRLYALVEAVGHKGDEGFKGQVVDETGQVYLSLTGYRTVRLPGEARL